MENVRIVPVGLKDWAVVVDGQVVGVYKTKKDAQLAALRMAMGVVGGR
jgi:hypothetical protein